jgi:U3 small nucleolar ribonucleoprotein component
MKPPKTIYATAYKNQNGEVIVQAGQAISEVMDSDDKILVGIYVLQEVVTAEKVVKTTPVKP